MGSVTEEFLAISPEYIAECFYGDEDIFSFCDPEFNGNTYEELGYMIWKKLRGYVQDQKLWAECHVHRTKWGYFFWSKRKVDNEKVLVSFCIKMKYRLVSEECFAEIAYTIGKPFWMGLWTRNERAIRWLIKMGGVLTHNDQVVSCVKFLT